MFIEIIIYFFVVLKFIFWFLKILCIKLKVFWVIILFVVGDIVYFLKFEIYVYFKGCPFKCITVTPVGN